MAEPRPNQTCEDLLQHAGWVRALAQRLVRDPALADDLAQETWLRVLKSGAAASVDAPRAWLAKVLNNVRRERARGEQARAGRERRAASNELLSSHDEQIDALEEQQLLTRAVAQLDEPYRSVIVWRYFEGISAADIARRSGVPAERIRWRSKRALELLRERMQREHGADWRARVALLLPVASGGAPLAPSASISPLSLGTGVLLMSPKGIATAVLFVLSLGLLFTIGTLRGGARPVDDAAERERANVELSASDSPGPRADGRQAALAAIPGPERVAAMIQAANDAPTGIAGRVLSAENGAAIAGVDVELYTNRNGPSLRDHSGDEEETSVTQSDAAGRFVFEGLDPRGYELSMATPGRVPTRLSSIRVEAGRMTDVDVFMELGLSLEVRVIDSMSRVPIPHAAVSFLAGERASEGIAKRTPFRLARAETDFDGVGLIGGLVDGTQQVLIEADGYANLRDEIVFDPRGPALEFELTPASRVYGRVTLHDGEPAVGARVFLQLTGFQFHMRAFTYRENGVVVDAQGDYVMDGVPAGEHFMAVVLPDGFSGYLTGGMLETKLDSIDVEVGAEHRVDLELPEPARVEGIVQDESGTPVEGAEISVSWGDFKPPKAGFFDISTIPGVKESTHHRQRTDAEGRFFIPRLRVSYEPLKLYADVLGFDTGNIQLEPRPGALLEPVVVMRRLSKSISGRLLDQSGEPIEGLGVGAWERDGDERVGYFHTSTDSNGRYEIDVPAVDGGFEVYPILHKHSVFAAEPERREGVPGDSVDVNFTLRSRSVLEGSVVSDSGAPLHQFHITLTDDSPEGVDDRRFRDLGQGRFHITTNPERHTGAIFTAHGFAPTKIEQLEGEVVVTLVRPPSLEGRVLRADGAPLAETWVTLASIDNSSYPRGSKRTPRSQTDAEGRFRLEGVPEELLGYLLVAPVEPGLPPLVSFSREALGPGPVELVLPDARPIELRVLDADGNAATDTILVVDERGWPLDPRIEPSLLHEDVLGKNVSTVLVDGVVELSLPVGEYNLLVLRSKVEQQHFPFSVGAGAGGLESEFRLQPWDE